MTQTKVAQAVQVLGLMNLAGEQVQAPVPVWVGVLLQSLPPDWREEVISGVDACLKEMAQAGQASRIIMPS